jgi:hydrogenase-4 component B
MESVCYHLLTAALSAYLAGILAGLLSPPEVEASGNVSFICAGTASLFGAISAALTLVGNSAAPRVWSPFSFPWLNCSLRLDPLGAYFLLLLSLVGLAASIYSIGYARSSQKPDRSSYLASFFNALLLSTALVFLANNVFTFLLAWELMSLAAWALVSFHHHQLEARNAGVLFFVLSHLGTACLWIAFMLLWQVAGDTTFADYHQAASRLSPALRNTVFVLFLLGFGMKAGVVPLHIWLPAAHPVAPSNVSAVLSAVIIKTGVYGMVRVFFEFLGDPPMWWGATVLVIGSVSALLGVLYALMEQDIKRLLAYSSIENVGIVLMGLGASLMFLHSNHPRLASLALVAGLLHAMNHAMFKGLLFLGAGAVQHSTHTRNMEDLGGLIKRMPTTALFFLIGAAAISALPPLNGFVSEWLTYQSLLQGFAATPDLLRLLFPLSGALLALTGALAAAGFVKVFGVTFLAQPRSRHVDQAREAAPTMLVGMGFLAVCCLLLGLFPGTFLMLFDPLTLQLTGQSISDHLATEDGWVLFALSEQAGSLSPLGLALMAICLLPIPAVLWWVLARHTITWVGPAWDCGLKGLTPRMQYTATGFSKPLRMIFRGLFRPRREIHAEFEFSRYFKRTIRFESHIQETFEQRLYRPVNRFIQRVSRRMRALQAGSIQAYLAYILLTLLLLLIFAL